MSDVDVNKLRDYLYQYFIESNIALVVSPTVVEFLAQAPSPPPPATCDNLELTKYLIYQLLSRKPNIQAVDKFEAFRDIFEFTHSLKGYSVTLYLQYKYYEKLQIFDVQLVSSSINANIKLSMARIPDAKKYFECKQTRYQFVDTLTCAVTDSFNKFILDNLDQSRKLPSPAASAKTSGASTPGGR